MYNPRSMNTQASTAQRDILLVNVSVLLWGIGDGLFYNIQPLYIEELGANPSQIGLLISLMSMATALTFIPSGYLADRLPRKPLMIASWLMGFLALLLFASAKTWQGLIPALVLYGLSAYSIPVLSAYLVTAAGGHNLERVLTTNVAAYTAGSIISPAAGGLLAETVSMRAVYLAAAGIVAISAVFLLAISPQKPAAAPKRQGQWAALAGSRFLLFAILSTSISAFLFLIFPLAPNYLQDVRGLNKAQIGILAALSSVGTTLSSLVLGRLKERWRFRALYLAQGMVWLSTALLLWVPSWAGIVLSFLLRGACIASRPLIRARGGNLLGEENRGLALGAIGTTAVLAQVLASVAAGWLYTGGPTWPFFAAIALIPLGLLLTGRLPGK
jgi:MFS family permease